MKCQLRTAPPVKNTQSGTPSQEQHTLQSGTEASPVRNSTEPVRNKQTGTDEHERPSQELLETPIRNSGPSQEQARRQSGTAWATCGTDPAVRNAAHFPKYCVTEAPRKLLYYTGASANGPRVRDVSSYLGFRVWV